MTVALTAITPDHPLWDAQSRYNEAAQLVGGGIRRTDHYLDVLRFTQQPSIERLGDALVAAEAAAALLDEAIGSAVDFVEQGRAYDLDEATMARLARARHVWGRQRVQVQNVRESLHAFADLPIRL